jgi:hypothetical protein
MVINVGIIDVVVDLIAIGWATSNYQEKALRAAPSGAVRLESVKAVIVNSTFQEYAKAASESSTRRAQRASRLKPR